MPRRALKHLASFCAFANPPRGRVALIEGTRRVTEDQKKEDFLSKAKDADQMAETAKGPLVRDTWQDREKLSGVGRVR